MGHSVNISTTFVFKSCVGCFPALASMCSFCLSVVLNFVLGHPGQAFLFTSFWLIGDRSFIVDCTPLHDPDGTAWHLGTHPEIMALFLTAKFRTWRADLFTGLREVLGSGLGDGIFLL